MSCSRILQKTIDSQRIGPSVWDSSSSYEEPSLRHVRLFCTCALLVTGHSHAEMEGFREIVL